MKRQRTIYLLYILLFLSFEVSGQTRLQDSQQFSSEQHVYKLSQKDLRKIHLKGEKPDESILHTFVTKCPYDAGLPELPPGNYMVVKVIGEQLSLSEYIVDDLLSEMIMAEKAMICLFNSKGDLIRDARIQYGRKKIKYDPVSQTYNISFIRDDAVIEIDNNGIYHYFTINGEYVKKKSLLSKIRNKPPGRKKNKTKKNIYQGFVVFSKPKYKPGEIVKLKAYVADEKGIPYNKDINVRLQSHSYRFSYDSLLTNLSPYRPGMFEYEFLLTDSLKLQLDHSYEIVFDPDNKGTGRVSDSFQYEDYELKGVNFNLNLNKTDYHIGDSVKVKFKVTDENDMGVYDGRVDISVSSRSYQTRLLKSGNIFVPDVIWQETIDMNGISEKEIVLPDSIFPKGISTEYAIESIFLNADNEKHIQRRSFKYAGTDSKIDFVLDGGIMTIKQLTGVESVSTTAFITAYTDDDEILYRDTVKLPYTSPVNWVVTKYEVKTAEAVEELNMWGKSSSVFSYDFFRQNDSIYLQVINPAQIPVWYTIRENKRIIASGYIEDQTYGVKSKKGSGYAVQLSYVLGGHPRIAESSLPYVRKDISMDLSTPAVVYPGQTVPVEIMVKDKKGKPVSNTDITAYAFTTKFGGSSTDIPVTGIVRSAKRFTNLNYLIDIESVSEENTDMTWDRWKNTMSLDTIEYYKFLHPDPFYSSITPAPRKITQLSPYIIINGRVEGVYLLWVDGVLFYAKQTNQYDSYSFPVLPGKHDLRFRTYDREIEVKNVYIEAGMRTILSVDGEHNSQFSGKTAGGKQPLQIGVKVYNKENAGILSDEEYELLGKELITIENNFETLEYSGLSHELPVYIQAYMKDMNHYINYHSSRRYNAVLRRYVDEPFLIGPFPYRSTIGGVSDMVSLYVDNRPYTHFQIMGGNKYTFYEDFQKIETWKENPFNRKLEPFKQPVQFHKTVLTQKDILEMKDAGLKEKLKNSSRRLTNNQKDNFCHLQLSLAEKLNDEIKPFLISFMPENTPDSMTLFYGGARNFFNLPAGNLIMTLVFEDSCYHHPVTLLLNGVNYVRLDSVPMQPMDTIGGYAIDLFKSTLTPKVPFNPYVLGIPGKVHLFTRTSQYNPENAMAGIVTGVIKDELGDLLVGVSVSVEGTNKNTFTDINGVFTLEGVEDGYLNLSFLGFNPLRTTFKKGYNYGFEMRSDNVMDDVVITTAGAGQRKLSMTGAITTVEVEDLTLSGNVAGIIARQTASPGENMSEFWIRGISTMGVDKKALVIVNGLPVNDISEVNPEEIISFSVLKDASATALYGAAGANGVILIEAKASGESGAETEDDFMSGVAGKTLRHNFHDDAFWKPRLQTDEKGKVLFEVTYPDDITSWDAHFIAITNSRKIDKKRMTVRSFKSLTAQLAVPRFAIEGDQLTAIGKITNHTGVPVEVKTVVNTIQNKIEKEVEVDKSYIEHIPVIVAGLDSLNLIYSVQRSNGYFDGEERSIPVLPKGTLETKGEFMVLRDSISHLFTVDKALEETTIYADISSLDIIEKEIREVADYRFMCNEQMASKLKALIAQKRINEAKNTPFKEDKKIKELIAKLMSNRNKEGAWGWWSQGPTDGWITKHVIESLLDAEDMKYSVNLDKSQFIQRIRMDIDRGLTAIERGVAGMTRRDKPSLSDFLLLLKRLDTEGSYSSFAQKIAELPDHSLSAKFKGMLVRAMAGDGQVKIDSVMIHARKTPLGSLYWADNDRKMNLVIPYKNNMQTTLITYQLLKQLNADEAILSNVRDYFYECRRPGRWRNTYESSRIIEILLPDILKEHENKDSVILYVNKQQITQFPYTESTIRNEDIEVKKEGKGNIFFTVYQQGWNENPVADFKDFSVKTTFREKTDTLTTWLPAGKMVELDVLVTTEAEVGYVMLEIPIPAGCSYDSNRYGNNRYEVHREYFKEKVCIFCNHLPEGEHRFTIKLIPRFNGTYSVNPARAELMYFPTFYGRENMKQIEIKESDL